jgi:hypothetical protein
MIAIVAFWFTLAPLPLPCTLRSVPLPRPWTVPRAWPWTYAWASHLGQFWGQFLAPGKIKSQSRYRDERNVSQNIAKLLRVLRKSAGVWLGSSKKRTNYLAYLSAGKKRGPKKHKTPKIWGFVKIYDQAIDWLSGRGQFSWKLLTKMNSFT